MIYDLDMQEIKTADNAFNVKYAYLRASLDIQQVAFDLRGLHLVSPAEYAKMNTNLPKGHLFSKDSRTNMDIFYHTKNKQIVLIKNGPLGNILIKELVNAHRFGEFVLTEKIQRDIAYAIVDAAKKTDSALVIGPGSRHILAQDFGSNDITDFMYTDLSIDARAKDYGNYIHKRFGLDGVTFYFDDANYMRNQKGSYFTKLSVSGFADDFDVGDDKDSQSSEDGAFGVCFNPVG